MSEASQGPETILETVDVVTLKIEGSDVNFDVICGVEVDARKFIICAPSEQMELLDEDKDLDICVFEHVVAGGEEALLLVKDDELCKRLLQILEDELPEFEPEG